MPCRLCDGTCALGDVDGLATAELAWLWDRLAAIADRKSDPRLATGSTTVEAPGDVAGRAAAAGLLGRRTLRPQQRVPVDLAALAARIAPLTPGAVAAHATGRRLATRAAERDARAANETELRMLAAELIPELGDEPAWAALRRSGWVTRILTAGDSRLVVRAAAVLAGLPAPGEPAIDRRVLAQRAATDPHELDSGRLTGGLVLAVLTALGRSDQGLRGRDAWAAVGVSYDDITGGLTVLGITPEDWTVPVCVPVTLPPRVLVDCLWPRGPGFSVFVTENPSVLGAAIPVEGARVVCTSGTPSKVEVDALARLAVSGWKLHVRADFDDAGINHVRSILAAAPNATPWRMGAGDYLDGLGRGETTAALRVDRLTETPWDPALRQAMAERGVAVFEEALLDDLLADIGGRAAAAAWYALSAEEKRHTPPPPVLQASFERTAAILESFEDRHFPPNL